MPNSKKPVPTNKKKGGKQFRRGNGKPDFKSKDSGKRKDMDQDNSGGRGRNTNCARETPNGSYSYPGDHSYNDASWYSRYPDLLASVSQLQFPYRPGMTIPARPINYNNGNTDATFTFAERIPGAIAIDWLPSMGGGNAQDAASQVGRELYARIRAKYSAELDADGPDILMYVMALDSIFAYIAWLKRIYRTLNAWSPLNYVTPDALLYAYGLNALSIQQLRNDKMRLYGIINELILQTRTFMIPDEFDIIHRHYWMSDNVYCDDQDVGVAQFYVFNPAGFYIFAEQKVDGGSAMASGLKLQMNPFSATNLAIGADDLYEYGQNLITALYEWSTSRTINGYLQRAFDSSPAFAVEPIGADEVLIPKWDPEVLMQIENCNTVLPYLASNSYNEGCYSGWDFSNYTVIQNPTTNQVVPHYYIDMGVPGSVNTSTKSALMTSGNANWPLRLNMRQTVPNPIDTVVASRLHSFVANTTISSALVRLECMGGTEIALGMRFLRGVVTTGAYGMAGEFWPSLVVSPTSISAHDIEELSLMESFDWHPAFTVAICMVGSQRVYTSWDVHNVTQISKDALAEIHRVCILSEFNAYTII